MPSKDILKRREAYRKWALKNKEKRREYQRILWIAKKHNPIRKACMVDGCANLGERHHPDYSKPEQVVWICRSHHKPTQHAGKCIICKDKVLARDLCNKHYKIERKKTETWFLMKIRIQRKALRMKRKIKNVIPSCFILN